MKSLFFPVISSKHLISTCSRFMLDDHSISIKIKNYLTKGSFLDVLTHTTAWIQVEKRQCRASQLSHAFHDHLLPGPGITRFKVSHYLFKFIRQSRKRLHKARSISGKWHAIWTGLSYRILRNPLASIAWTLWFIPQYYHVYPCKPKDQWVPFKKFVIWSYEVMKC